MEPASDSTISETNISQTNFTKYKQIISTLPQTNSEKPSQNLYKYQGFWCFQNLLEGIMHAQEHFIAQSSDIFICSLPKSGTTWLKSLCFSILKRTHFDDISKNNPFLTKFPPEIVQNIEFLPFRDDTKKDPYELPLWCAHIPYNSLPKSILESNCKIIYICRDPKDVCTSFWHFLRKDVDPIEDSFEHFFDKFCEGVSLYGPYWDHNLGYWKTSLEFPEKILFIKYEDLQNDTFLYVKKLAEFMGCPFSTEEEKHELVQKIVNLCSFENLSNLEVSKSKEYRSGGPLKIRRDAYFRKGKVGDWKNHFTPEMADQIDKITDQKLSDSGLSFRAP